MGRREKDEGKGATAALVLCVVGIEMMGRRREGARSGQEDTHRKAAHLTQEASGFRVFVDDWMLHPQIFPD